MVLAVVKFTLSLKMNTLKTFDTYSCYTTRIELCKRELILLISAVRVRDSVLQCVLQCDLVYVVYK